MKPPGSANAQRLPQQLHGLVFFATHEECNHLQNHHLEPFIRPTFCSICWRNGSSSASAAEVVSLSQTDPGLADGKLVRLCEKSSCLQIVLTKPAQAPVRRQSRASEATKHAGGQTDRASAKIAAAPALSPRASFRRARKHLRDNESINNVIILPRQLEALLPMLLSAIQIIPLVEYAGHAKMRIAGIRLRIIT